MCTQPVSVFLFLDLRRAAPANTAEKREESKATADLIYCKKWDITLGHTTTLVISLLIILITTGA